MSCRIENAPKTENRPLSCAAEGSGIIYNRYEVTDGKLVEASVLITLIINENENIVG